MSEFTEAISNLPEPSDEDWEVVLRNWGADEVNEDDAVRFAEWAEGAQLQLTLVSMVMDGKLKVKWSEEKEDWAFALTDEGEQIAKGLLGY